jgi:hypothetical protein
METKVCKACGIEKELNEFHKGSWGEFGRVSRCMKCIKDNVNIPKEKPITETDCRNEALKYSNRTDFRKFALKYLNRAKELGVLDELFTKRPLRYTLDECKEVARNCKDYVDFRQNFNSYYQFCRVNDLLKEIQKVLPTKVANRNLTKEEVFEIGSKYNSRTEFSISDSTAYMKANNLGIMDELFPKPKCENCDDRYCNSCKICKSKDKFLKPTGMCRECRNRKATERKIKDPLFKLTTDLRSKLLKHFKKLNLSVEKKKNLEVLGCSWKSFKNHIELQFESWMNWENRGDFCEILEPNCSWDLDHIIPLSKAKNEEELYLLNHWSNFQPLCSFKNRNIKKNNIYPVTNLELNITIL